jgi:hypothetical protein
MLNAPVGVESAPAQLVGSNLNLTMPSDSALTLFMLFSVP